MSVSEVYVGETMRGFMSTEKFSTIIWWQVDKCPQLCQQWSHKSHALHCFHPTIINMDAKKQGEGEGNMQQVKHLQKSIEPSFRNNFWSTHSNSRWGWPWQVVHQSHNNRWVGDQVWPSPAGGWSLWRRAEAARSGPGWCWRLLRWRRGGSLRRAGQNTAQAGGGQEQEVVKW